MSPLHNLLSLLPMLWPRIPVVPTQLHRPLPISPHFLLPLATGLLKEPGQINAKVVPGEWFFYKMIHKVN